MPKHRYFNSSATAQLVIDPICNRVIAVNQEACRILERAADSIEGGAASKLFAGCFVDLIVFTDEVMERGRAWSDALSLEGPDGKAIKVEVTGRCSTAGDECLIYLSIQMLGEVDRRRIQSDAQRYYSSGLDHWGRVSRVFQEFEHRNQLLLDAAGEGIYGIDSNGVTTFVNPAAERILGYSITDLAGKNMHSVMHHSHADGSPFDQERCPIFEVFRDGVAQRVEDDIFWNKQGDAIDVEYTSTPILENGMVMGAVVVFRDVTQRKADRKHLLEALTEVEELKNRLELENAYLQEELNSEINRHHIIGKSQAVQTILQQVNLVAPTDAAVLIHGESGTGKELIARAIHEESHRSARSLIRVNCAAIPEELFESEFFGHVKGSFTGANQDRTGRFQLADGGTLFLDEVGEIPLHLQGKLLRVLQEMQFERVGESSTRHVDVRIIAATNRDLRALVDDGKFREDLYFRLNVFPIQSIPLRQRPEDIPSLAQYFLERSCSRAGKPTLKVPLRELQKLQAYHWPGNIRELENVIERQIILAQGEFIRFDELAAQGAPTREHRVEIDCGILTQTEINNRDRRNILLGLEQCRGKVFGEDGAAALLGLKPTTLYSRIQKYKIDIKAFKKQSA